ncbi:MAG: 6-phosphogluconolactonase [Pseudomonadales bacterium]|nr:6-phosphogluconolactonase [Pseudomonadales bacterium]
MWQLHEFSNPQTLIETLSQRLISTLTNLINFQRRASIALSGGSTPAPLYRYLSQQTLDWSAVTVSLVDERWVEETNPQSNARLIRNTLLQNQARHATMIGMKTPTSDAFAAAENLGAILERQILPLDLVLLGMGLDGHTASLIPGAKGLDQALDKNNTRICFALQPRSEPGAIAGCARMSLGLNTLLGASERILYLTGAAKRAVLESALQPGSAQEMPVRAVLHDHHTLTEIYYAPDH